MKIRSEYELIDFLSEQKKNRKRELITIQSELSSSKGALTGILRRSAVVLSYAHWEGFVRDASTAYVSYVSRKSSPFEELANCFQAIACRNELRTAQSASKKILPHIKVVNLFRDKESEPIKIDSVGCIDTESNLNWKVFENICLTIGIGPNAQWLAYEPFINELVKNRCSIAHGETYCPDKEYASEAMRFAINALDWFSTDIENAAQTKSFLKKTPAA